MNYYRRPQNQTFSDPTHILEYLNLLPVSICRTGLTQNEGHPPTFTIHTFGCGSDHDSSAMHAISNASGRTFSFIESVGKMLLLGVLMVSSVLWLRHFGSLLGQHYPRLKLKRFLSGDMQMKFLRGGGMG
ncbi:Uncharacterized protein Adt_06742 [Abeliophyllum distichum]|uniref:Uncharacterized protein n=1 Tax=Abeliophyllum distichum TaxID=126358 RepID=A0ABD1V889_9LAMI